MKVFRTFLTLLRRITFRKLAFLGLLLIGFISIFYAEENWRGHRAWEKYVRETTAQGLHAEWESFIPAPVPDADNFAMTPLLAELYDFIPGTQTRTNSKTKIENRLLAAFEKGKVGSGGDWMQGEHVSFARCLTNRLNHVLDRTPKEMSAAMMKRYGLRPSSPPVNSPKLPESNRKDPDPKATALIDKYRHMTTQEQAREILRSMESLQPIFDELRLAMKRPYCRYPLKYDQKMLSSICIPHLGVIEQLGTFLRLSALCHLELKQSEAALADLELGFYLSNSLKNNPWYIIYLYRCRMDHGLTQAIWEGTSRHLWSATQLERLQKLRPPGNEIPEARRVLLCERAMGNRTIDDLLKLSFPWRHSWTFGTFLYSDCYLLFSPRGWIDWEKIHLSQLHDNSVFKLEQLPSQPFIQGAFWRKDPFWQLEERRNPYLYHHLFTGYLGKNFEQLAYQAIRAQAASDLTYLGCALERYWLEKGEYPDRLAEVMPRFAEVMPNDLVTGEPYRYRLQDKNHFVLYSIGIDGKDGGGTAHYNRWFGHYYSREHNEDWLWLGGNQVLSTP